jgi:hypothetical protein
MFMVKQKLFFLVRRLIPGIQNSCIIMPTSLKYMKQEGDARVINKLHTVAV